MYIAKYSIYIRNQRAVSVFVGNYGESRAIRTVDKCLPNYTGSHPNLQYSLYVEVIPVPARNMSLCNRVPNLLAADISTSTVSHRMYTRDHMPRVDSILW